MIKAVLFDFFGVLHPDTLWGLADVFIPDRDQQQKQALSDLARSSDLGMLPREQFWAQAADMFGIDVARLMTEKDKLGSVSQPLMNLVKQLKDDGVKTGVISNVGVGFLEHAFVDYDTADYFDQMVMSGEVGVVKPDQRIYQVAAERLGVQMDECYFFDDSERNVSGAQAAGMQAQLYEGVAGCRAALQAAGIVISN